jgi:hypothetical protein
VDDALLLKAIMKEMLEVPALMEGPKKVIYCYRPLAGGVPSREFLEQMIDKEARASYAKQFQKHCQGEFLRGDKWRPWTEDDCKGCSGLYEYKDIQSKSRLMHITEKGHLHVLLFGFTGKKENKVDNEHVQRAKALRDEYKARRAKLEAKLEAELAEANKGRRRK